MTDIKDLELRIKSAESTLEMMRGELEELRQQQQQEPESLFGRWATHPEHGRGIITEDRPDPDGTIEFRYRAPNIGAYVEWPCLEDLDLDPVTPTTVKDFEDAPEGTIVEAITEPREVYVKGEVRWYIAGYTSMVSSEGVPPCRVIRWGNGQ